MLAQDQQSIYGARGWRVDLGRRELRARDEVIPIGARAFDLLAVLAQSAGQLVTKNELITRVWPGAIVEESNLRVQISRIRKALGTERDMLRSDTGRGYRLLGGWVILPEAPAEQLHTYSPAPRPAVSHRTNIPAILAPLIGRETAGQHLQHVLSTYRIVTLTGPGGIGKTALALDVARGLFPAFTGDVLLVELASLSDARLVPSTVAAVLGLQLGGELTQAEPLARAIGSSKLLLVLDNCEHVADAAATLGQAIVRLCPRASLLVTSREVLRIDGEYVYRVPPLEVPLRHEKGVSAMLSRSAVQMFIAKTTALGSDFSPGAANLTGIADICRRLDGIPLAIEFAAALVATLGVRAVAARLDDRFRFLTYGRRTAMPRHQTLRAALDWSYELLPQSEQQLMRRLAVFASGFTLAAATTVSGHGKDVGPEGIEALANLVSKSLVMLAGSPSDRRWRLLETTRAYALEKLDESGEASQTARRHAEYYRDLFEVAETKSSAPSDGTYLAEYTQEIDDIRAALDWSLASDGDDSLGVALTVAVIPLWLRLSLMAECRERVQRALATPAAHRSPRQNMRLYLALGGALLHTIGPGAETISAWEKALEITESLSENDYRFRALWGLWVSRATNGDHLAALTIAETFTRSAPSATDPVATLIGERMMGFSQFYLGDPVAARPHIEQMLSGYVSASHRLHRIRFQFDLAVTARAALALILWLMGSPKQAMCTAERGISEARSIDHAVSLCSALAQGACQLTLLTGDLAAADRFTSMLLDYSERHALGVWHDIGLCYKNLVQIKRGACGSALRRLRSRLAELPYQRFTVRYIPFMAELATALGNAGQVVDGLSTIDEAVARSEHSQERWFFPELLRIKARLLQLQDAGNEAIAEEHLIRSLNWARRQHSIAWELRTAVSLARLRHTQGRDAEARDLLTPVYGRFTEGFSTADLKAARQLLGVLG